MSDSLLSHLARFGLGALALVLWVPGRAEACATTDSPSAPPITITAERAVIIWDEAHQTEHFIRQASMLTQSPDIGFLVPTPDVPELAEAGPQIFAMAASLGQPTQVPPINERTPWELASPVVLSSFLHLNRFTPGNLISGVSELQSAPGKSAVLSEKDVAGYHATILAAEDESQLSAWLQANHYVASPELKAWLKPYIAGKWRITAFKLIKTDDTSTLTTRAIRLTFHTTHPFYPYSEPSDRQQPDAASPVGRALQVAVLSNQRMQGSLANKTAWPGRLEYAGPSTTAPNPAWQWLPEDWYYYAGLGGSNHHITPPTELTTFIDESNPRPGTADLYFSPDHDQRPFRGEAVDFNLAPQDRLIFTYSLPDLAAFLMLVLLPVVPFYCGWRVLKLPPEENLNSPRHRRAPPVASASIAPPLRQPWVVTLEFFAGVLAITLGLYYGVQFTLLLLGQLAAALFGWSGGHWIWTLALLALAAVPVAGMSWGVIFCGANVCRIGPTGGPRWRSPLLHLDGGERQGLMALFCCLAGIVALLVVLSIFASL